MPSVQGSHRPTHKMPSALNFQFSLTAVFFLPCPLTEIPVNDSKGAETMIALLEKDGIFLYLSLKSASSPVEELGPINTLKSPGSASKRISKV